MKNNDDSFHITDEQGQLIRDILKAQFEIDDKYCCPGCGAKVITRAYEDDKPDKPSWYVIPGIKEDSYIKFEWQCRECGKDTLWFRTPRPSTIGEWLRGLCARVESAQALRRDSEDDHEKR